MDALLAPLEQRTGLPRDELLARAEQKRAAFGGFLTPTAALRLLARENGVPVPNAPTATAFHRLADATDGAELNVRVRVQNVTPLRAFEKNGREGSVLNADVADETGTATLVFWGSDALHFAKQKIERNACVAVTRARVKTLAPLELHASLLSKIEFVDDLPGAPKRGVPLLPLASATDAPFFDCVARVLKAGEAREFQRAGRTGRIAKLLVADATAQRPLALWDANALLASALRPGDVLRLEGASARNGELHAGKATRVLVNPRGHDIREAEALWKQAFKTKALADVRAGDEALVSCTLARVDAVKELAKCRACNSVLNPAKPDAPCACGATERKTLLIAEAMLRDDATGTEQRAAFFNREARELLGYRNDALAPPAFFDLKKDHLAPRALEAVLAGKESTYHGGLELVVNHVVQLGPLGARKAQTPQ